MLFWHFDYLCIWTFIFSLCSAIPLAIHICSYLSLSQSGLSCLTIHFFHFDGECLIYVIGDFEIYCTALQTVGCATWGCLQLVDN